MARVYDAAGSIVRGDGLRSEGRAPAGGRAGGWGITLSLSRHVIMSSGETQQLKETREEVLYTKCVVPDELGKKKSIRLPRRCPPVLKEVFRQKMR